MAELVPRRQNESSSGKYGEEDLGSERDRSLALSPVPHVREDQSFLSPSAPSSFPISRSWLDSHPAPPSSPSTTLAANWLSSRRIADAASGIVKAMKGADGHMSAQAPTLPEIAQPLTGPVTANWLLQHADGNSSRRKSLGTEESESSQVHSHASFPASGQTQRTRPEVPHGSDGAFKHGRRRRRKEASHHLDSRSSPSASITCRAEINASPIGDSAWTVQSAGSVCTSKCNNISPTERPTCDNEELSAALASQSSTAAAAPSLKSVGRDFVAASGTRRGGHQQNSPFEGPRASGTTTPDSQVETPDEELNEFYLDAQSHDRQSSPQMFPPPEALTLDSSKQAPSEVHLHEVPFSASLDPRRLRCQGDEDSKVQTIPKLNLDKCPGQMVTPVEKLDRVDKVRRLGAHHISTTSLGSTSGYLDSGSNHSSMPTITPAVVIHEYLMDFRFSCGIIEQRRRSSRQMLCYWIYLNPWKRSLVSGIILLHCGLAFAELHIDVYIRRDGRPSWRPADTWIQALHFVIVLIYIADMVLMTIGLTAVNLDPRRNARNFTFFLLVLLVAADTLLAASDVTTSSFSLPLRGLLLLSQLPGTVRMFCMWMQMVYAALPLVLGFSLIMGILAVVVVVAIRDYCPRQHECSEDSIDCITTTSPQCQALLSDRANLPSALAMMWNLAGSAGHSADLQRFLDVSEVFGLVFFAISSAICTVWFRFMWLSLTWYNVREMSRRLALAERLKFMRLITDVVKSSLSVGICAVDDKAFVPMSYLVQETCHVWPSLNSKQRHNLLQNLYGNDADRIPIEHVGALAWLLHAECDLLGPIRAWIKSSAGCQTSAAAGPTGRSTTRARIAARFVNCCAILSLTLLIVSAWLPDTGVSCRTKIASSTHHAAICTANVAFDWLDVLLLGVFLVEFIWIMAREGSQALTSVWNLYKGSEVLIESLMVCIFFRANGMGNMSILLRLLRVPRILHIYHFPSLCFLQEVIYVTLVASTEILLLAMVFVFFFGAVIWQALTFTATRTSEGGMELRGFSDACYGVYLMLIGDDWHVHASTAFDSLDSGSQIFGLVLLLVAQFIGGQVLLHLFASVLLESWKFCRNKHTALQDVETAHVIRFKCARNAEGSSTLRAMPWAVATFCFTTKEVKLRFKTEEDRYGLIKEHDTDFCLAYARIDSCRVMHPAEGEWGINPSTADGCLILQAQDLTILIDAKDSDLASSWAHSFQILSRAAQMQFELYADVGGQAQNALPTSPRVHNVDSRVQRRCSAIDIWIHDLESLPLMLPMHSNKSRDSSPRRPPAVPAECKHSRKESLSLQMQWARSAPSVQKSMSSRSTRTASHLSLTSPGGTPGSTVSMVATNSNKDASAALFENECQSSFDEAKERVIAAVQMFKGLHPLDANALATNMRIVSACAGDTIISKGLGSVIIWILSGTATVYDSRSNMIDPQNDASQHHVVRKLKRGHLYGDHELFSGVTSGTEAVFATADTSCNYIILLKDELVQCVKVRDTLRKTLQHNASWLGIHVNWLVDPNSADRHSEEDQSGVSSLTVDTQQAELTSLRVGDSTAKTARRQPDSCTQNHSSPPLKSEASCAGSHTVDARPPSPSTISESEPPQEDVSAMSAMTKDYADAPKHTGDDNGRDGGTETVLNGVTFSSRGPEPVYFSALSFSAKQKGPCQNKSNANDNHKQTPSVDSEPRRSPASKTSHSSSPRASSPDSSLLPPRSPTTQPQKVLSYSPATPAALRPQTQGVISYSPETPAVFRESQDPFWNNDVVLPPGAGHKLASKMFTE